MLIRPMEPADWPAVAEIYKEGIATEHATFQTACPPYPAWDASHIRECRLVILAADGAIAGWAVLSRVNMRWCYRGVAEVSIYVGERYRGRGYAPPPSRPATGPCSPPSCRTTRPATGCTASAVSGKWAAGSGSPATATAAGWTPG